MIDRLAFAAPFVYSPRGTSEISRKSRRLRDLVKRADPVLLPRLAGHVATLVGGGHWPGFFGPDITLVPVPGRAPLVQGALWVPDRIARVLQAAGLAREVWPTLRRTRAIAKSAFAKPGERPELDEQFESLAVDDRLPPTGRILLVDDFITKGRTLLAAASRLQQEFPDLEIRGFTMVRTKGLIPDIAEISEPVVGEIRLQHGDAYRDP